MESNDSSPAATTEKPAVAEKPKPVRVRHAVSPEIAANIREEGEAVAATINTAQLVANAAINAAKSAAESIVANAVARRTGAFRPILRQLGLDDERATIVATEGYGADTVVVIELAPVTDDVEEVPNG